MSKTPLCYTLTPSSVTDSMMYLKFLEQLISASFFWGLETHKCVLPSCCPFSKQSCFTDQQLPQKGQTAKGAISLASLSFLLNFYKLSSAGVLLSCVFLHRDPISPFPLLGLSLFFHFRSLKTTDQHVWCCVLHH